SPLARGTRSYRLRVVVEPVDERALVAGQVVRVRAQGVPAGEVDLRAPRPQRVDGGEERRHALGRDRQAGVPQDGGEADEAAEEVGNRVGWCDCGHRCTLTTPGGWRAGRGPGRRPRGT